MAKSMFPRRTPSAGDITVYAGGAGDLTPEQEAKIDGAVLVADLDTENSAASHEALLSAIEAAATDAATKASTAQAASLQKGSNLSDIVNAATARTNLGLGSAATQASSAFEAAGAASSAQAAAIADATTRTATERDRALAVEAAKLDKTAIGASGAEGVANYDATELKLGQVLPLIINIQSAPYNAALDGSTNDATAISTAIAAASTLGGGRVTAKYGKTAKITSAIVLKSNVHVDLPITILPTSAVTTACFVGASGDTVSNVAFTNPLMVIDGNFGTSTANGIQVTNGSRITVDGPTFRNIAASAVLFQGTGSGGGTPDSVVRNCRIDGAGLSNGTTGFGIQIKDASPRCKVTNNLIRNVVGGMGVGLAGASGTGYPTNCTIATNTITMATSTTGFEAIGVATGCDYTTIADNVIPFSYDNGISATSNYNVVEGNSIGGCYNHGIALGGKGSSVAGNIVKNPGQQDASAYGFVSLAGASYCTVVGNTFVDDQSTHTASYGIKGVSSGGFNIVGPNVTSGVLVSDHTGLATTDFFIDSLTNNDGFTFNKAHFTQIYGPDASTALIIGSGLRATGITYAGSNTYGPAQFNVSSNLPASRPSLAAVSVTGQVADAFQVIRRNTSTNAETVLARIGPDGDIEITDPTKGFIMTTPDGTKRFRMTINNSGVMLTTLL